MANALPEVQPVVSSMPTIGWFLQTSGSARRKIIKNKGSATAPVYEVSGIPRHTHNASALISVDADYKHVRTEAGSLAAGIWSAAAIDFPAGTGARTNASRKGG